MTMASNATASAVAHDDQLENWASDMIDAIMPWLREPDSYDDKVQLVRAIKDELRDVVRTAFNLASGEGE